MKNRKGLLKRLFAAVLAISLVAGNVDLTAFAAEPAKSLNATKYTTEADPGTAHTFETIMGQEADGNRYAGRLWVDKSVYKDGDTAILNTTDAASDARFQVSLEDDEAFQVIFSVLGSSMTTTETRSSSGPMDVVLILDNSVSMNETQNRVTRMQRTIEAANGLISNLLSGSDVRLGITSYAQSATTVVPFGKYTDGITLSVDNYTSSSGGRISARNNSNQLLGRSSGYQMYTNTQAGYDMAMQMLESASNTAGRTPVVILLTDGAANTAVDRSFYDISKGTVRQEYSGTTIDPAIVLSTLLGAAYRKASVEDHYGKAPIVYGIGVDLSSSDGSNAIINPKVGFNSSNTNSNVRTAYNHYINTWSKGNTVTISKGRYSYSFDHNYPAGSTVNDNDVMAHINYVDNYHDVTSAGLEDAFTQIYEELTSSAFNPITSTTTQAGGTGVKNTPLIYVDDIGQYMEVKNIQAVTLFGASYGVTNNGDGTYTVQTARGLNPTTNEAYNTSEDIIIKTTENADGTQRLQIEINQEILPILLEQVASNTVGKVETSTIEELIQRPLRVYYTVGLDSEILLPNGEIDLTKIDKNYPYLDKDNGTLTFYSNAFNVKVDGNIEVKSAKAHAGFKPSAENRYYYHQANQEIYVEVKQKNGSAIQWDKGLYGVLDEKDKYDFTELSYDHYNILEPEQEVYTYVEFYRPTTSITDAATAAEKVKYIVYTDWAYLKASVAFYDNNTKQYINYDEDSANGYMTSAEAGYAIPTDVVKTIIEAYLDANPNADLVARLGVGSLRTSRFHNMESAKTENITETAELRYDPDYTHVTGNDIAEEHHDNDVVVWLGNNGKLTVNADTGIALTKAVTETIGNINDTYALTVTILSNVDATPVVTDSEGTDITATKASYSEHVLTVNVKAGETVYISGIPVGTVCTIGENIPSGAEYYVESKTSTVTIPSLEQVLDGTAQYVAATVTNAPSKYGNLYITKEIESDHNIPEGILNQAFAVEVNVGTALAGEKYEVADSAATSNYEVTVDNNGLLTFNIKARQTIEILGLPAGTEVTITEEMTTAQDEIFDAIYETRNHSGETEDNDNKVIIPADTSAATAVITNKYAPKATTVRLDIAGTKNFKAEEGATLPGGTFEFKVEQAVWSESEGRWTWQEVAGKTAQVTYAAGQSGTKTFTIENVLDGITFEETGTFAYQVLEVKGDVANVTYDRTLYIFDVVVTDNNGQLEAKVTDLHNTEIKDSSYEVTFENTYHTAPVSIDIIKDVKNETGDATVSKAGFDFKAVQTNENWVALTGDEAASLTVSTDATGHARFAATYTKEDTYYYVVSEVNAGKPGWNYSRAQYHVTVTVKKDGENLTANMNIVAVSGTTAQGETAVVNGNSGTISFVNSYEPDAAEVNLDALVKKSLTGRDLVAGEFEFKVYENNTTNEVASGKNDKDGNVDFVKSLEFNQIGKYEFDIKEVKGTLPGIAYDNTIFDLVVEVRNDISTGKLVAFWYFEDSTTGTATFHNTYTVIPTDYTLGGVKKLNGRAIKAGEFSFELYEEGSSTPIETVTNKVDGSFTFSKLNYDAEGTYTYTIKEVKGTLSGVHYRGAENPVTVTVTVTGTSVGDTFVLSAVADKSNAAITFENDYQAAPAYVTFNGTKTFKGGTLSDGMFAFKLYQTDRTFSITNTNAVELQSVENDGSAFAFEQIKYEAAGTYFYVIAEDTSALVENVVYDNSEYHFQVQVRDNGKGQLLATITNEKTGVTVNSVVTTTIGTAFVNATFDEVTEKEVYWKDNVTTEIDGKKVEAGDELTYFITYTNYNGKDVEVDIVDTIPAHTSYVEGSASDNGTYAGGVVDWILNVPQGESVTVSFKVKVDDVQAIFANTAVVRDGVNTYYTNEVVNHSVDEVAEKDVFNADDTTVSIDGKKVKKGETLQYVIEYHNITGEAVDVIITDDIPKHTTYVADSADQGGVYADGTITWNLKVPAWSSVKVTFQVTVDDNVSETVTIANKAEVNDGKNRYTTNEVTSKLEKEVETPTTPATPTPSAPKTGDNASAVMWSTLTFASIMVCGAILVIEKKRRGEI